MSEDMMYSPLQFSLLHSSGPSKTENNETGSPRRLAYAYLAFSLRIPQWRLSLTFRLHSLTCNNESQYIRTYL